MIIINVVVSTEWTEDRVVPFVFQKNKELKIFVMLFFKTRSVKKGGNRFVFEYTGLLPLLNRIHTGAAFTISVASSFSPDSEATYLIQLYESVRVSGLFLNVSQQQFSLRNSSTVSISVCKEATYASRMN